VIPSTSLPVLRVNLWAALERYARTLHRSTQPPPAWPAADLLRAAHVDVDVRDSLRALLAAEAAEAEAAPQVKS